MTTVITPSPYLRDGLRRLVAGLRKDAETVRLNLAQAEQDVAAARQLLAEAEAQHQRAKDQVNALDAEIAFFEEQAERTPPAYDPDAALAATGLMPTEETVPYAEHVGHRVDVLTTDLERTRGHLVRIANGWLTLRTPEGEMSIPDEQVRHVARAEGSLYLEDGDPDDLTAPGVADSRAQVAPHLPPSVPHEPAGPDATHCPTCESPEPSLHPAVSGGGEVTHICDDPFHGPVPHEPAGVPVATSGPTVTMPDTGLNPPPLPPANPTGEPRHAKPARPGLLARLTGGHRIVHDEQDGDA